MNISITLDVEKMQNDREKLQARTRYKPRKDKGGGLAVKAGCKIRLLRRNRDLTLEQLSTKAGLSLPYLSKLENGKANPSLTTLIKLAQAFDCTVSYLLIGVDCI